VVNNLIMQVKQNSLQSIIPDLAIGWSWNENAADLTSPLRKGVSWHDGKPFTASDFPVAKPPRLACPSTGKMRPDLAAAAGARCLAGFPDPAAGSRDTD